MKTRISLISAIVAMATVLPSMVAAASVESVVDWPTWIGRLNADSILTASPARRASQGLQYMPRSLIRSGEFQKLLQDARTAKFGTVDTPWPEWVDDMSETGN